MLGMCPRHPEFILSDILKASASVSLVVFVDDSRQLLHLETLSVVSPNLIDVGDNVVKVPKRWVNNELLANAHTQTWALLLVGRIRLRYESSYAWTTSFAIGRTLAMVSFLEFAMRLCHDIPEKSLTKMNLGRDR